MLPILLYFGPVPISSLGVFLVLGFFYAMFLIWRLARAWDFDEEKILDLLLFTGLGAVIGARIYFALTHLELFTADLVKIVMIFKYPGFSFWGGFLGGWLALNMAVKRYKLDFWSVADIASVGFLGALIFGDIGCFLAGCGVGVRSSFLSVSMVGQLGNRLPIQLFEGVAFAIALYNIWPKATHFHIPGKILSMVLICVGGIKLIADTFRDVNQNGQFFSVILILLGVSVYYKISRKSFRNEARLLMSTLKRMFLSPKFAKMVLLNIFKSCYNLLSKWISEKKISWKWRYRNLLRKLNVGTNPKNN